MHRADAFTPFNLNLSARTGSARACARDRQNRHKAQASGDIAELDKGILKNFLN